MRKTDTAEPQKQTTLYYSKRSPSVKPIKIAKLKKTVGDCVYYAFYANGTKFKLGIKHISSGHYFEYLVV